jgi:hypothetical protein
MNRLLFLSMLFLGCRGATEPSELQTLRIPHTAFSPAAPSDRGVWRSEWLEPASLPDHQEFRATFTLPRGAVIIAVRARLYRETGHELAIASVWSRDGDGLFAISHQEIGWRDVLGRVIQQRQGTEFVLTVELSVPHDGALADVRIAYVDIDYQ